MRLPWFFSQLTDVRRRHPEGRHRAHPAGGHDRSEHEGERERPQGELDGDADAPDVEVQVVEDDAQGLAVLLVVLADPAAVVVGAAGVPV